MSVRKTKSGIWFVDIRWPDGIRTRSRMPDESTARQINKKIEVSIVDEDRIWTRLRKNLHLDPGGSVTFSDLADHYFNQYVKSYNRDVRVKKSRLQILKTFFRSQSIETMSPQYLARFIAFKKQEAAKSATVNRYLALIRHMMHWAGEQGIIESNPLGKIEKLKEPEWIGIRPDESLIDHIFDRLDSRVLPAFVFLRETGCRRGEAIRLKLDQIDFTHQVAQFRGDTKSGRGRQVPLTEKALWAVQALPQCASTVFYHPTSLNPFTGDGLAWLWDKARGDIKLRIHDLRHAFAIRLAEEGCPMHYISEVLGHSSLEFTRRRYARFSPESASRSVLRILEGRKAAGAQNGH